jgi:hypothetical protein
LARPVTEQSGDSRDNACMTSFQADREIAFSLAAQQHRGEVDDHLRAMHVRYHDQPREHVGVHVTWMRIEFRRRAYHRALFHAFAGFVVAGPASLVQRHTGLVVPAFKARD